jgi:hypothetical protein
MLRNIKRKMALQHQNVLKFKHLENVKEMQKLIQLRKNQTKDDSEDPYAKTSLDLFDATNTWPKKSVTEQVEEKKNWAVMAKPEDKKPDPKTMDESMFRSSMAFNVDRI